jgi:hypothetical protein
VESLNAEGQWIIMMGFLVSLGIFFLAIIISQSTLVGQTTAEGVLEFPKNDIQDLRHDILEVENFNRTQCPSIYPTRCGFIMDNITQEIKQISLYRKSAIVNYNLSVGTPPLCGSDGVRTVSIHYNNGVTAYDENPITIYC